MGIFDSLPNAPYQYSNQKFKTWIAHRSVTDPRFEAWIIVIIEKRTQDCWITRIPFDSCHGTDQLVKRCRGSVKSKDKWVISWVVERVDAPIGLITSHVRGIAIEYLALVENTRSVCLMPVVSDCRKAWIKTWIYGASTYKTSPK